MRMHTKELAKFFSGFEAFHAIFHAYLLVSGTPFSAFGIDATAGLSTVGVVLNAAFSILLGVYGWRGR